MSEWISKSRLDQAITSEAKRALSYHPENDLGEQQEQELSSHLIISKMSADFSVWRSINIDWEQRVLTIMAALHHRMLPLRIGTKSQQQQIARLLNRINAGNRLGCFVMNVHTGNLQFRTSKCFGNISRAASKKIREDQIVHIMEQDNSLYTQLFDFHLGEILAVANLPHLQELRKKGALRVINSRCQRSIERINQYLKLSNSDLNQILETYVSRNSLDNLQLDASSLERIHCIVSDSGAEHLRRQPWTMTSYSDYLEADENLSKLSWEVVHQGQTYAVSKVRNVKVYSMRNTCPDIYSADTRLNLVRKVQLNGGSEFASNEGHVYRCLNTTKPNPNIVRLVECKQEQRSAFVCEEFEGTTLLRYLSQHQDTCSIQTKLHLLVQIAKGLRALYIRNILYLNLKQSNIVVARNLDCMLHDMSWAVMLCADNDCQAVEARHITRFDMSVPEALTTTYSTKTDVYFMGKLMMGVLLNLEELPLDRMFKLLAAGSLQSFTTSPKLAICKETIYQYLPAEVAQQLMQLCWKCISDDPHNRPAIEWVIAILSEVRSCLQFDM